VIFPEHFGENRVILSQTVAKWRCIKLCAIFFWATLYLPVRQLFRAKQLQYFCLLSVCLRETQRKN